MTTYDQKGQHVDNQTNVAGNEIGVNIGDIEDGINHALIIGRDVIRSILVTGDHNQFFVGDYESLRDAYIEPWSVFERVNLKQFVGREWLAAKVDTFLHQHDRGYFILEAEAGLGKTAFMAWLVQQRGYIHHFSELAHGQEMVGDSLKNLASQLALAHGLKPEGILPSAATRPDYLVGLLRQATARRQRGEKIVLVVDALDEAGTPLQQNVLGLPSVLPEGVFVIVSQRPVTVSLDIDAATTPRCLCRLSAEEPDNQADMECFLEQATTWPGVAHALHENGYTVEHLKSTLLGKCLGIWIYLHYIVHEIERGERSPLELEALPNGITEYYAHFWRRWRDEDETKWYEVYLPLLTTLAAAQEAISLERLLEWSDVNSPKLSIRRLLAERWRPYLATIEQGSHTRYRFYHATLQEFFDGQLKRDILTAADEAFIEELFEGTRTRHHSLADRYLEAWGGWEEDLNGLKEEQLRDIDEGYGLRYLATHLASSDRVNDLHHLLRVEWASSKLTPHPYEESSENNQSLKQPRVGQDEGFQNVWYTVREKVGQIDGYLADITRARQLAINRHPDVVDIGLSTRNKKIEESWQDRDIGLQCRYALILASLNSHAHNIRPGLLVELIKQKIWLPAQGLSYTGRVTAPHQRAEMLETLASFLPCQEQNDVMQEALSLARSIEENSYRSRSLTKLALHLSHEEQQTVLQEVLSLACSIEPSSYRAYALVNLASYLSPEQLQEALSVARSIKERSSQADALTNLALHLSHEEQQTVMQEALSLACSIEDTYDRADALVYLVSCLAEQGDPEQALSLAHSIEETYGRTDALVNMVSCLAELGDLNQALSLARSIEEISSQADALTNLAPHLSDEARQTVLQEALSLTRSIKDTYDRARTLANLAPRLAEQEESEQALSLARSIEDNYGRADALVSMIPYLSSAQLQEVLTLAHAIEDTYDRARILVNMVSRLAELGDLNQALTLAHSIESSSYRAEALANLASHLAERGEIAQALSLTRSIEDPYSRADTLVKLAPHLSSEQLQEVLSLARSIKDRSSRARTLAELAPHLSSQQLREALSLARSIEDGSSRARTLHKLVSRLAEQGDLKQAFSMAHSIESSSLRASALAHLLPHLAERGETVCLC